MNCFAYKNIRLNAVESIYICTDASIIRKYAGPEFLEVTFVTNIVVQSLLRLIQKVRFQYPNAVCRINN